MSDATDAGAAAKRADQKLGKSRMDIVAAVDEARRSLADKRIETGAPAADERAQLRAADRPAVSEEVDRALGKSREEAVEVVQTAVEAVTEDAAQTEPATEAPREGRREAEFRARERKLAEGQQRMRRDREEFDAYRSRVERELAEARESTALAQRDPFAWFERYHGIKRAAFGVGNGASQDGAPNVALEQASARIRHLEERDQTREQERQEQQRAQARERELDQFVSDAKAGEKRWPLAARYTPGKLKARGWDIAFASARSGVTLSNDEVLDRIEEELSEIVSLRAPKNAAPPKSPETPGSEERPSQQPTLNSRGVSESAPNHVSPLKLSHRERIERSVQAIEEAKRAKRPS